MRIRRSCGRGAAGRTKPAPPAPPSGSAAGKRTAERRSRRVRGIMARRAIMYLTDGFGCETIGVKEIAMTPVELSNPIYNDEEAARRHLESLRWPDGAYCP